MAGHHPCRPCRRPNALPWAGLLLALLVVLAASGASWVSPSDARAQPSSFFGVAPATSTSDAEMRRLAAGGAGVMRFPLEWLAVQPRADGPYEWRTIDKIVMTATRHGVTPLPSLIGSPSYASWDPMRAPIDSASARRRWQQFLRAAVRRYGTTGPGSLWREVHTCDVPGGFCEPGLPIKPLHRWQVWNEPNMKLFWKPAPNAAEYAQLLRLSGDAIHAVDAGARIVIGGLTPGGGRYGPPGTEFLDGLYRSAPDAAGLFDAVAMHPYEQYPSDVIDDVEEIRAVINAHGDPGAGIWITEFGWATGGPAGRLVVTPTEQADRIGEVMETLSARRARYGLEAVLVFTDHDYAHDASPCQWCPYSGMMLGDGTPKPSWLRFSGIANSTPAVAPQLVSTGVSNDRVASVGRKGRRRGTSARVTTTVERYADGSAIVELDSDDLGLTKGGWQVTSCLRFLGTRALRSSDHFACDRQELRITSRRKAVPPGDQLSPLGRTELGRDPYASRQRVVGYVQARKRQKGHWRTRLTSLQKNTAGIPLP